MVGSRPMIPKFKIDHEGASGEVARLGEAAHNLARTCTA